MAWTSLTYSFGSVLTSTKMTQNQDNFTALADGTSAAPKIQTAALEQGASVQAVTTATIRDLAVTNAKLAVGAIVTGNILDLAVTEAKLASSAVSQSKLKSSTGEVSTTTFINATLPGGAYGFYPQVKHSTGGAGTFSASILSNTSVSTTYVTNIYLNIAAGGGTLYAQQLYLQSSPPYDLGDGEIPLFVFLLIDSLGVIRAAYSAEEAPWHYNGPTDIRAHIYDEKGVGFQKTKNGLVEVSQIVKNRDMEIIPHPFVFNNPEGLSVVLLDPVSPLMEGLATMNESGEGVLHLLHDGELILSNNPINRHAPPGVQVVNARWKLS